MRLAVIVASVVSVGALAVLSACAAQTSSDTGTPVGNDAGPPKKPPTNSSSGDAAPSDDGGASSSSSSGGIKPAGSQLVNAPVFLWGVTDDGMVIYQPDPATPGGASDLEAMPLGGGTKTTIAAGLVEADVVSISGGAVAWWTAVTDGLGTFNVWTKASGAKTAVATGSLPEFFSASHDGSRIAFSVSGAVDLTDPAHPAPKSTKLSVTGSAAPTSAALKFASADVTVDLASQTCAADTSFAGNVLLSGHCAVGSTAPHLYAVGAAATAATRLDGTGATTTLQPMPEGIFWSADATGSKVFAIVGTGTGASGQVGRVFDPAGGTGACGTACTIVSFENETAEGWMLKDGSAVVYRTVTPSAATIVRSTTASPTVKTTLLAAGTLPTTIQSLSRDSGHLLFSTLAPPATGLPLVDIRAIDTTSAAQAPVDIVATGTAYPLGFTGDSSHVLYYTDVATSGVTLKTKTPGGAGETTLATNIVGARPAQAGAGVLLRTNKQKDASGLTTYDLQSLSAAAGGAPTTIAAGVPAGLYDVSGSKLVYVSFDKTYAGLYVANLP